MTAEEFIHVIQHHGVCWFTGVPCSFFQSVYTCVERDMPERYVPAANEGVAMAMAAGAELAGRKTAVLIQNSGLGNLLNPLTSLHAPYRIPGLLFVSGRGFGVLDEPQHELMGRITERLLALGETNVQILAQDLAGFDQQLSSCQRDSVDRVSAFIVPKGAITSTAARSTELLPRTLSRPEALQVLADDLPANAAVLSTTGKTSREWSVVDDQARSFYVMGSMGHVMSIALGVAVSQPTVHTVAVDGDGSVLMHLGALSTIGAVRPTRFLHVVIDNETYESTGNQRTSSNSTDIAAAALACGYAFGETVESAGALRNCLKRALAAEGPALIRAKVNLDGMPDAPRITASHTAPEIADRFRNFLDGLT